MNPNHPRIRNMIFRAVLLLCLFVTSACAPMAQAGPGYGTARHYSQAELDQMLAPIALYPDALLSQILMAATYPVEVVEAAHWSAENPGYQGQQAVQAVEMDTRIEWDPSVKSLVAFPQLLKRMEENISWTQRLGVAFRNQQAQVMDTIQSLRRRAMEQGTLRSSEQIYVYPQAQIITIEPANPQIVYVPYYDPNVVYGAWWWGSYPPVYWAPWPGYYSAPYRTPYGSSGVGSGLIWGSGIAVGTTFFFGMFDWREHHVHVHPDYRDRYDTRWHDRRPPPPAGPAPIWRHDPERRPATPYRPPVSQPLPAPTVQPAQPALPAQPARPSRPSTAPLPQPHYDDDHRDHRRDRDAPSGPDWRERRDLGGAPAPAPVMQPPRERGPVEPRLGPAVRPQSAAPAPTPVPAPTVVVPAPIEQRGPEIGVIRGITERVERANRESAQRPAAPDRQQDRGDRGDRGGRDRGDGPGDRGPR